MTDEKVEVTLSWKFLERIAEYYSFPSAVFLSQPENFPARDTRINVLCAKARALEKIKEIIEEEAGGE